MDADSLIDLEFPLDVPKALFSSFLVGIGRFAHISRRQ
jgi:hypothetical protein